MARTVHDVGLLLDALRASGEYADACGTASLTDVRLGAAEGWLTGHPGTDDLYHAALDLLRSGGAEISAAAVEPAPDETSADELVVLLAELKDDLDEYLERRDGDGPRSLGDVVEFNRRHAANELAHFGQDLFEDALASGGREAPAYAEARARCLRWAVEECLSPALEDDGAPEFLVATRVRAGVEERPLQR